MKRGTTGHWKILNLAMELKVEPYAAVGICCCMWEWVGNSLMTGNIGKADDAMIAHQIGWTKKPSILIDALVKVGLLDRHPEHRLVVHDWSEHADDGVHTWLVRRRLWFADGKPPRTRHLHSNERADAERFYGSSTTPPQSKCGENVAEPPDGHNAKAVGTVRIGTDTDKSPHTPQRGAEGDDASASQPEQPLPSKKPASIRVVGSEAFESFWARWPSSNRRDKPRSLRWWTKLELDAPGRGEAVLNALAAWKQCERWREDGGRFVPKPYLWLRERAFLQSPPSPTRNVRTA